MFHQATHADERLAHVLRQNRLVQLVCLNVNAHEIYPEDLSRKGAKAQSATAFLKSFLCAFAPLRLCARTFSLVLFVQSSFMICGNGSRKVVEYATYLNATFKLIKRYLFCCTTRHAMPAARREVTARRQISRLRHYAFD